MGNMILGRPSFYEDFIDDRISGSELFHTVGGIEKADYFANESISKVSALNTEWNIKYPDDEIYELKENIPDGNNFFHTVRFLRTLLLYVCNGFKFKSKQ
jgi:hypothetical protein